MSKRTEIVRDALIRFPEMPLRTVARYILYNYGLLFDNDLEKVRDSVRYFAGKHGDTLRKDVGPRMVKRDKCVMPKTWREVKTPYRLNPGTWLCMFDIHVPFHEPKAIDAAIRYGRDNGATGIFYGGDLHDCGSLTFWPSIKRRNIDAEIEVVIDFLDYMDKEFPDAMKVWQPGNHEYRLPRYYMAKAPELIGMPFMAFDAVLGLECRGIEMLQHKQMVLAGKLPIFHGHEFPFLDRSVSTAKGLFNRTKMWAMCGHTHNTSEYTERNIMGKYLTTWSVGALCDLNPDYNPFASKWNWGVALVHVDKDGSFEVDNRRILPSGKVV